MRFGPSFENIAWSSLFLLAPLGCIYYPIEILPEFFQVIAKGLPLVYIFDETRNILINGLVDYENIKQAYLLNLFYLISGIGLFYLSFLSVSSKFFFFSVDIREQQPPRSFRWGKLTQFF